ncbi:MAG: glycosyltransferase family 39 protein [Candidatus Acidiferrum sp.]
MSFLSPQTERSTYVPNGRNWRVRNSIAGVRALKLEHWIVLSTILGSLIAAWIHIHNSSIWYDEAITLLTTSGHAKLDWSLGLAQFKPSANLVKILYELYEQDVHPPLYFWTLALWRVAFGPSLEVARWLSALFTAGTLALLYRVARDLRMKWPIVPGVIYAVSAVGLRYAYNARPYAMVSFLIVLTFFLAGRKSRWTGVCAAACIATHYFAALCVVPILLLEGWRQWRANRTWVLVTAASFAACCAPLIPLLRIHLAARPLQYAGFGLFHIELWWLFKGAMESILPSTWLPRWGFALVVGGGFALLGIWWARRRQRLVLPFVYGAFLLGFFLLAMATNKSVAQMPVDYYLGIAAPLLALLIGFGVNEFPRGAPLLALVLITGTVTSTPMTKSTNYRSMALRMHSECPECPILVGEGYVGAIPACVLYEARNMKVSLLQPEDTVGSAMARMGEPKIFFLVPSNEPATAGIEHQVVQAYPASRKNGYFEVDTGSTIAANRKHRIGRQ